MSQPLRSVGDLSDVQDMTLISDCRNLEIACENFRKQLTLAQNYHEGRVLCDIARCWEQSMAFLSDLAFKKLEEL